MTKRRAEVATTDHSTDKVESFQNYTEQVESFQNYTEKVVLMSVLEHDRLYSKMHASFIQDGDELTLTDFRENVEKFDLLLRIATLTVGVENSIIIKNKLLAMQELNRIWHSVYEPHTRTIMIQFTKEVVADAVESSCENDEQEKINECVSKIIQKANFGILETSTEKAISRVEKMLEAAKEYISRPSNEKQIKDELLAQEHIDKWTTLKEKLKPVTGDYVMNKYYHPNWKTIVGIVVYMICGYFHITDHENFLIYKKIADQFVYLLELPRKPNRWVFSNIW